MAYLLRRTLEDEHDVSMYTNIYNVLEITGSRKDACHRAFQISRRNKINTRLVELQEGQSV